MVYVEVKTIGGRQYQYLRESVRKGGKVVHKMVKYLGPVDPKYKKRRVKK